MTLGTIILLALIASLCIAGYILTRWIVKFNHSIKHFQWLWNSGLQESACIVDLNFASWKGLN